MKMYVVYMPMASIYILSKIVCYGLSLTVNSKMPQQ